MKLDLKLKLLIILIIPLFFVIGLSITLLYEMLDDKNNLEFTKHHILEAEVISRVVHSLQIERGVTTGVIARGDTDENNKDLSIAKENSDVAIDEAQRRILFCKKCVDDKSIKLLDSLKSRENVNLLSMPISEVRCY